MGLLGLGAPSVGCDRLIATATRSGSGDPELQTLAVNDARLKTAPTGNARSGSGPPSVGCDRQIATATRSGSGDPELQTLGVPDARFQTAPTGPSEPSRAGIRRSFLSSGP